MYPVVVVAAVCLLYTEFLQAASVCLDAGNVTCAVMVHNVTGIPLSNVTFHEMHARSYDGTRDLFSDMNNMDDISDEDLSARQIATSQINTPTCTKTCSKNCVPGAQGESYCRNICRTRCLVADEDQEDSNATTTEGLNAVNISVNGNPWNAIDLDSNWNNRVNESSSNTNRTSHPGGRFKSYTFAIKWTTEPAKDEKQKMRNSEKVEEKKIAKILQDFGDVLKVHMSDFSPEE